MNILWNNYVWDEDHPATIEQVRSVESKLNIKFPSDFLEVATNEHGKMPNPNNINVGDGEIFVNNLYHFEDEPDDVDNQTYGILGVHEIQSEYQDQLLIPFASSGGGSDFCFDYRDSKGEPTIIFLDSDLGGDQDAIIPLAKNFTEFLGLLYEDED